MEQPIDHPWLPGSQRAAFAWLPLGVVVTLALAFFDGSVHLPSPDNAVGANSSPPLIILQRTQWLLDWPIHALIVAALILFAAKACRLVIGYLAPVVGSTFLLHGVKFLVGRARPELNLGAYSFELFSDPLTKYDSLPSGHACSAFVTLTLIGIYLPWLRWPMWVLAGLFSALRVAQGMHFPSDVACGALFGLATVAVSVRFLGADYYRLSARDSRINDAQLDPSPG